MSPLRKLLLPIVFGALIAALLLPSAASAGSCKRDPNSFQCRQVDKFRERSDERKGITPACRAAANKYQLALTEVSNSRSAIGPWKTAVKKAKGDKAKRKAKRGLAKARKRYKAAKSVNTGQLKAAAEGACADAKVKPF